MKLHHMFHDHLLLHILNVHWKFSNHNLFTFTSDVSKDVITNFPPEELVRTTKSFSRLWGVSTPWTPSSYSYYFRQKGSQSGLCGYVWELNKCESMWWRHRYNHCTSILFWFPCSSWVCLNVLKFNPMKNIIHNRVKGVFVPLWLTCTVWMVSGHEEHQKIHNDDDGKLQWWTGAEGDLETGRSCSSFRLLRKHSRQSLQTLSTQCSLSDYQRGSTRGYL